MSGVIWGSLYAALVMVFAGVMAREEYLPDHYMMQATGEGPWVRTLIAGALCAVIGFCLIVWGLS